MEIVLHVPQTYVSMENDMEDEFNTNRRSCLAPSGPFDYAVLTALCYAEETWADTAEAPCR